MEISVVVVVGGGVGSGDCCFLFKNIRFQTFAVSYRCLYENK